ncbi:MAG: amino acid ABC transporter permease, partial [Burkholderiaceae bacterium]
LLATLAACWTELFRNIPVLVQVFLWYHVLPVFLPALKSASSFLLASVALGLFTSARIAEQVRAGINALPAGQQQAATALGLTLWQRTRLVILPQALRLILPTLTSEAMNIVKNSSVAFAVSVTELTLFAMQAQEETARGMEIYAGVTLLYVSTALLVNRVMVAIENWTRVPAR